jgi:hypothetical protein
LKKNLTTGNPYRNTPHYEDPQGIPDQYVDIVEELRNKVQNIRLTYIQKGNSNRQPDSGNAAAAKLELDTGGIYSKKATSKRKPLNVPGQEGGSRLFFDPRIDRASFNSNYNQEHAEYKIFNAIAEDLERDNVSLDAEGILYLYTEKDMCSGCNVTCDDDFKARFPNIQVIIFYKQLYP